MSKIEFTFTEPFSVQIDAIETKNYPVGVFDIPFAHAKAAFAAGVGAPTDPQAAVLLEDDEADLEPASTPIIVEAILEQTVKEIEAQIPAMELTDLEALLAGETAKDKPRKGLVAAIEAEIEKVKANPDAANEPEHLFDLEADAKDYAATVAAEVAPTAGPDEAPVE